MSKSTDELYDEIMEEAKTYRCKYLQELIDKYVTNQEFDVEISLRNFKTNKPPSYLKRIRDKPFGSISTYECTATKVTVRTWKKKVILQKRACFRKYVGAESSADNSTNFKYMSRNKAYKMLLSVQKDNSYSSGEECENTLLNEAEFDGDQIALITEGDESTLTSSNSSFSSDIVKISSKKRLNREDEIIKNLATSDSLSANNVEEFSNFTIKNCNVNLLKPNKHRKLDLLIENFSTVLNNSVDKTPNIMHQKVAIHFKGISYPKEKDERNFVSSVYNDCSGTSVRDYIASKSTPKLKLSDIGLGVPNTNSQISKFCNVKSLPYASNNSIEISELKHSRNAVEIFNKNCQNSSDCDAELLSYNSKKRAEISKSKSEEVDVMQSSSDCNSKSSCLSNKSLNVPKLRPRKDEMVAFNENSQNSDDSNTKSLPYASNKHTMFSKLRPRNSGKVISNQNCHISSDCKAKLSSCVSNKSTRTSKLRPKEDRKVISTKNCQSSNDCNVQSLSYASIKPVDNPNLTPRDQTSNKDCAFSKDSNSELIKSIGDSNLKCGKNETQTFSKNYDKSNECNAKSFYNTSNKLLENPNLKPKGDRKQTTKNCDISNSVFCASANCAEDPNLKQRQDGKSTSNKSCKISNNCNTESLSYDSNKCSKVVHLRSRKDEILASNKNDQTFTNCTAKSLLSCALNKCTKATNLMPKKSEIVTSDDNCKNSYVSDTKSILRASDDLCTLELNKIGKQTFNNQTPNDKSCTSNKSIKSTKSKPQNNGGKTFSKNVQTCNDFNTKSLSSASNKFAELSQLKFSKIDNETSSKKLQASGDHSAKSLSCVSNKYTEVARFKTKEGEMVTSKKSCETSNISNSKSLSFASNKHTGLPKLKPIEDETETSKIYASNVRNAKSLRYASFQSIKPHKHKNSDIGTRASNRNCQTLLSSFPLRCTSHSFSLGSNLGIPVEIDPLSRFSDFKKSHKKKSSLSQSTLPFNKTKSYKKFLEESVTFDDLSLKSPRKTLKERPKDECLK